MKHPIRFLVVFLGTLAWAFAAQAADCDLQALQSQVPERGYDFVLRAQASPSCLGDVDADQANPLVQQIGALAPDKDEKDAVGRFEAVRAALKTLSDFAADRSTVGVQTASWIALARELKDSDRQIAAIGAQTSGSQALAAVEHALPDKWGRLAGDTQGEIVLDGGAVKFLQATRCDAQQACPAYESQRDLIRVFNLVHRVRGYAQSGSLAAHYADAKLQSARWDAYRSQGQHQYIWEVWINGLRMDDSLCPRDTGTGIQRGFCSVPTSQLIVLHPEAGLRWSNSAKSSSDLQAAFLVEVLGYYRWDWDPGQPAQMGSRYGGSLVAAYSDTGAGRKWSYGPMLHVGSGYNLAFTRSSDGKWGLLLNLNLADRYFGRKQAYTDYLQKLQKPGLGELLMR